uniref:Uncharacterized protein n=1 Tax=Accipiter nisus TaxID=211598 RepID=A0A8B9MA07_9AVES
MPSIPQLLLTLGSQLRPWLSLGSPEPAPHPHPLCPLSSSCCLPPLPTCALCQLRLGWRTWQTACSPPAPSARALLAPGCSPASNLVSTPGTLGDSSLGDTTAWKRTGLSRLSTFPQPFGWLKSLSKALQETLPAQESPRLSGIVSG